MMLTATGHGTLSKAALSTDHESALAALGSLHDAEALTLRLSEIQGNQPLQMTIAQRPYKITL